VLDALVVEVEHDRFEEGAAHGRTLAGVVESEVAPTG
jgi:hypothetical protein